MQLTSLTFMKTWVFVFMAARNFLDGIEEFFIVPTAWYYIKSLGETQVFLGMVLSIYGIAAILAAPILGKFSDRFGYVKSIILICYAIKVIGNLIYSIPVSAYFPLVGRAISGLCVGSTGVLYGQLVLYTHEKHRAKVFLFFDGMYCLGTVFGPAVSSFLTFNVNVFGWKINAGNSPGVVLAIIWFVSFMTAWFLPSKLGDDVNPQEKKLVHNDSEEDLSTELDSNSSETSKRGSLSTILCIFYILFLSLFYSSTVTFYAPVLAQEHYHLPFIHVKLLFVVSSIFSLVLFIALYIASEYMDEIKQLAISCMFQITAIAILTYFAFTWGNFPFYGSYILLVYVCVGMPYFTFPLGCSLLSKVTDPKDAAFYQGSSFSTVHFGFVVGRTISGFVFTKTTLLYYCFGLILSWVLGSVWFAVESRNIPH